MNYLNGREAVVGDSVVRRNPENGRVGAGVVARLVPGDDGGADLALVLIFAEIARGTVYANEPIEVGGRLFEPMLEKAAPGELLQLEEAAAAGVASEGQAAELEAAKKAQAQLSQELAEEKNVRVQREEQLKAALAEVAGLKAALTAEGQAKPEAAPVEDKATLSLFPEAAPAGEPAKPAEGSGPTGPTTGS